MNQCDYTLITLKNNFTRRSRCGVILSYLPKDNNADDYKNPNDTSKYQPQKK